MAAPVTRAFAQRCPSVCSDLQADYEVQKAGIIGPRTQTSFTFHGLRDQSVHNIKLLEGADVLWVDEAQNVCKKSRALVIPTMVAAPPGHRGSGKGGQIGLPSVTRSNVVRIEPRIEQQSLENQL